jgi:WD40 repeat protein
MLTLIPGSFGCHTTGQHGQVWCVCWRPDKCHSQLAAGFSDGSIAVWQVNTRCPWLRVTPSDKKTTILLPAQQFSAHTSVVRCLSWSAVNTNIIVSAAHGKDSTVRVWNLCDVSSPVQDLGQSSGWVYEIQWLTYWNVIALVGDLSLVSSVKQHAELIFLDRLHHKASLKAAISLRNSPYLSVSFSDWNNTLAFSCADGTVLLCILPSLTSSLVPIDGDWTLFNVSEELSQDSETVSIVFKDFSMHDFKSSSNPGKQELGMSNTVLLSPLNAINKVQWNPNYKHRLWLLSGCRSGLVRLTQVGELQYRK